MPVIRTNSAEIAYREFGSGTPLLLIHGFPLDGSMWDPVAEKLAQRFRVLIPDLRGFGASPWSSSHPPQSADDVTANKSQFAISDYADDLVDFCAALGVEHAIVCGLSMGGYVALSFALHHRDRLLGLILCDTRAAADTPEAAAARKTTAERVFRDGTGFLAEAMLPKLYSPQQVEASSPLVERTLTLIQNADPRGVAAAALAMAARPNVIARLEEITVPTLVICGEADVISPPAEMAAWSAELPRGRFVRIADAGHMSPEEQPETFVAAVLSWAEDQELI
ncbi:MAG: alpha/beta hydrolase [Pirellulales bacterium]